MCCILYDFYDHRGKKYIDNIGIHKRKTIAEGFQKLLKSKHFPMTDYEEGRSGAGLELIQKYLINKNTFDKILEYVGGYIF